MPFTSGAMSVFALRTGHFRALHKSVSILMALLLTGLPLHAQKADDTVTTIKKDVNVVSVLATVRDKQGKIVATLNKDDFALEVDGKPQTIRYFARVTDTPLTLGLLVDTSYSQRRLLEKERTASYTFLNDLLNESRDKAFVMHFDFEIELLQDLTSSRPRLQSALQKIEVAEPRQVQTSGSPDPDPGQSGGGRGRGGGTKLYDSIFLACDEITARQQGRKAIIILSDGVDQGSKVGMMRAIEAAQRSNTIVYTILFADKEAYNRTFKNYPGGQGGGGGQQGGGYPGGGYPGGGYPRGGGGGQRYPGGGGYPGGQGGGYPGGSQGGGNPGGNQGGNPGGGGGRGGNYPVANGKQVMVQLAQQTGGRFFEVAKHESIDDIYKSIGDELRNQYSLGFTPDHAEADGEFHKINVTTTQKDLTVQAREGYYSGKQP